MSLPILHDEQLRQLCSTAVVFDTVSNDELNARRTGNQRHLSHFARGRTVSVLPTICGRKVLLGRFSNLDLDNALRWADCLTLSLWSYRLRGAYVPEPPDSVFNFSRALAIRDVAKNSVTICLIEARLKEILGDVFKRRDIVTAPSPVKRATTPKRLQSAEQFTRIFNMLVGMKEKMDAIEKMLGLPR